MTVALRAIRRMSPAGLKAERERDQAAAMREYAAERAAVQAKTARLRALRLAKQAIDTQTAAEPKKKRRPCAGKATLVGLDDVKTPSGHTDS